LANQNIGKSNRLILDIECGTVVVEKGLPQSECVFTIVGVIFIVGAIDG